MRVEQLYPFPQQRLREILAGYPGVRSVVWVQEEPANMGPWSFVLERSPGFLPAGVGLARVSRAPSPSPATGNANVHKKELEELLGQAFG